uniref:Uncharacterized protein n=1 Tax=Arcella intermedia TaxID=1963864 RepID=A0A6B2L3Q1_9EUKA
MIRSWGPTVVDVFVALELDPQSSCAKIDLCPPVNGSATPVYPKPKLTPSGPFPNPATGTIFHVSDIHYDHFYTTGTNTDCGMPVCCHPTYGNGPAGTFGDYNCDTPKILVQDMLNQMKNANPDYLIYTGDTPAHDLWLQTHKSNVDTILNVTQWVLERLPAKTKYFPALGNHAAAPVDNFGGPLRDFWLYGPVGDLWSKFLPTDAVVSFKFGGYYTAVMEPGLRVIALQTNYYDNNNLWLKSLQQPDIAGQLTWLGDVLSQIKALGEKAIIIAHEKPASFAKGPWQQMYLSLINQYKDIIVTHFMGHNHNDLFQVLHDPSSNGSVPISVVFIPSSLTPVGNTSNPSYRIYSYDQLSKEVLDFVQYRVDLVLANQNGYLDWYQAYTAKKDWKISDMSPKSWQSVGERIGANVQDWNFFKTQYHGGVKYFPPEQLDKNQKVAMCTVLGDSDETYATCMK